VLSSVTKQPRQTWQKPQKLKKPQLQPVRGYAAARACARVLRAHLERWAVLSKIMRFQCIFKEALIYSSFIPVLDKNAIVRHSRAGGNPRQRFLWQ
jgi:hypothetical protein